MRVRSLIDGAVGEVIQSPKALVGMHLVRLSDGTLEHWTKANTEKVKEVDFDKITPAMAAELLRRMQNVDS